MEEFVVKYSEMVTIWLTKLWKCWCETLTAHERSCCTLDNSAMCREVSFSHIVWQFTVSTRYVDSSLCQHSSSCHSAIRAVWFMSSIVSTACGMAVDTVYWAAVTRYNSNGLRLLSRRSSSFPSSVRAATTSSHILSHNIIYVSPLSCLIKCCIWQFWFIKCGKCSLFQCFKWQMHRTSV